MVASLVAISRSNKTVWGFRPTLVNLGHDFSCQAVGGHQFGALTVHGRQAVLPRVVDESHARKVDAEDWLMLLVQRALPARLQFSQPGPCQPPFELERKGLRLVVDRNS